MYPTESVKYLGVKIDKTLVGSIILMISLLNWIEPMHFSSKWENMLVLKY